MIITKAEIRNFKGLAHASVDGMKRVTLIGGRNNVGKTSLMEALFLLYDRTNARSFIRQLGWRGVPQVPLTTDGAWAPFFYLYNTEQEILISASYDQGDTAELYLKLVQDYSQQIVPAQDKGKIETQAKLLLASSDSLRNIYKENGIRKEESHHLLGAQEMKMHLVDSQLETKKRAVFFPHSHISEDADRFSYLDKKVGERKKVVEILQQTIEPRLKDISLSSSVGVVSLMAELEGLPCKIPVRYMGSGTGRLLSIILGIYGEEHIKCVFIDEIENGVHYSILPELWKAIALAAKEYRCQIFATTHSYDCLKAAAKALEDEEEFCYVRLNRKGDEVLGTAYSRDVLAASFDMNLEMR
jgi:predicted ATPase